MNLAGIADLGHEWRTRAETLRAYGAAGPADAVERCAGEFEDRLREWWTEPLSLRDAAEESGFSYDRLQRMVGEGDLPNVAGPALRWCAAVTCRTRASVASPGLAAIS